MTVDLLWLHRALATWRRRLLLGVPALFGGLLLLSGGGASLDKSLHDLQDRVRAHAASGQVEIVEIDASSLARIDHWPWPRAIHAAAIDTLHRSGARSIAFDVDFSSLSTPEQDARLARALTDAGGTVILPAFGQNAGANSSNYIDTIPAKMFREHAFLAAVNVIPDDDVYVRTMPLGVRIAGMARPSLAAMVAERDARIGRSFDIDYAIDPASIPRISMIDLLSGAGARAGLAGKRVIIGATAAEMGDRYAVPGHGVIPGVVIQALAAETLLEGPVPQNASGCWPLLLALALIAWAPRGPMTLRRRLLFIAGMGAIALLPLATEQAFAISMPLAPAFLAFALYGLLRGAGFVVDKYIGRALTDRSTGLPNVVAMESALDERGGGNVIAARIDRFVAVASGLGPTATAQFVSRIAGRLSFSNQGRAIFRIDEGCLGWIEEPGEEDSVDDRLAAIAVTMRAPVECGRLVDATLNFGLATPGQRDTRQLIADATLAALHAAQKGSVWDRFLDADSDETNWHLSLLGELDAAIRSGALWNAYQPKLDIRSGTVVGAEALVRWLHPERGPIAPDSFIPLVEEHGRARDLTAHVLRQALDDAAQWDLAGFPIGIAVNVSATLLADHAFIEVVGRILEASRLSVDRVTIEVTESAAVQDPERAIAALESWARHGVAISIDDYGTGQSSLGYLQTLPASELKIDKSFVRDICEEPRNAIMVRSTIALAHELGMKVVAEGVEDANCLALLGDMSCDTAQGYHIARPMAAEALRAFLSDQARRAA